MSSERGVCFTLYSGLLLEGAPVLCGMYSQQPLLVGGHDPPCLVVLGPSLPSTCIGLCVCVLVLEQVVMHLVFACFRYGYVL